MAGEIKSTLTLDVTKFASAIDRAIGGAESLEKHLKSAAKVAADFDKGITGVGNDLAGFAKNFRLLDQTVEQMVTKLTGVIARFDQLGQHSTAAAKGVEQLGSAVKKTTTLNAGQWVRKYTDELDKLAPAIKSAIASVIEFDRANIASANIAEKTADKSVQARLKSLNVERDANKKIIADRERLAAELLAIEETMRKRADANSAIANRYKGGNINHPTAQMYRGEAATANNAADTAAAERAALEAVIKEMKWQNAEIEKRIALEKQSVAAIADKAKADKDAAAATTAAKRAEREAALAAKQAAAESAAYARDAARERMRHAREAAAFERQEAMQLAQMWKGMGQLWGASKIERGVGAAVDKSATMQDVQLRVKAWGIKGAELEEFNKKAFDLARQESYLSNLDAIQGRLTAIASIGYNKVGVVDATVGESLRTVTALKTLGYETGNTKDIQRNLYGIAETRQVMNDPRAINRTFDTAFRLANVSEGKITLADIETVLRNLGPGANQISDRGLMNITALAEQAKVAGGHGAGGAGAGVSSVGTMIKMAQLYAMGKPISNTLLEQLAGAGLTSGDIESMEALRGGRAEHTAMLRAMKSGGLKNQMEIMEDPVTAMWKMRDPIMKYISGSAKNRALYFGDANADTQDEKMQLNALQKFWSRSGLSNKAISQMVTAQDPRFHHRTEKVTESALAGDNAKQVIDMAEQDKNWNLSVQKMKKGAEDLAGAFEPLIKSFSFIPEAIGDILSAAGKFAKDNPMIASLGLITAGVVGMNLAIKGVINTFGMVGTAASIFKTLASGATAAQTSTAAATTSMAGFGRQATVNATAAIQAAMAKERLAEAARVAAVRELESAQAVVASKTGFDRLRAVQETLIPAQQNAAKATAEHAAAHANVGRAAQTASIATQAMAGASKLLSGALSLVGGPLGLIAIALTAGVALWQNWSQAAETAASKASKAADTALEKLQKLKDQEKYGTGDLGAERKTLEENEKMLALKVRSNASDLEAYRAKTENQRALVEELERREYANQPKPIPAPKETPTITPDFKLPTVGGGAKNTREFQNAFQRSLEQQIGRQSIESLKLSTILTGQQSYDEQARAAFMEKWLGGDFDDGKDPSRRKFTKEGATYSKARGWQASDVDLKAVDKQTGKTPEDWMREYAAAKQLEDIIKGVTFATERAAATNEDASVALDRLTGKTAGQTDAMRALNREFARQEAANPALTNDAHYLAEKRDAKTGRAAADYANEAADLIQKNKEMEAQFLLTERERLEAGINAKAEAERKKIQILMQSLDEQIRAHEEAGDIESEAYMNAIKARKDGEAQFTQYLQNIQRERELALMSPVVKMVREWQDVYKQLETLQERWASSFMDNLSQLITTGKADWRSFMVSILSDLSKVMMKKSAAGLLDDLTGTAGIGGIAKAAWQGTSVAGGGRLGAWMNQQNGYAADGMGPPAPAGLGAAATGAAGAAGGAGEVAAESAKKLGESLNTANTAVQATATAQQGATAAITAGSAAQTANTSSVVANTGATTANTGSVVVDTAAESTNTAVVTTDTAAEVANTGITQSSEIPTTAIVTAAMAKLAIAADVAAIKMLASANGNAFGTGGLISAFANGGGFTNSIVDTPTFFNFGGSNLGVMGEAGPEAVMPLTRDSNGRLGVSVNGASAGGEAQATVAQAVTINITVNEGGKNEKSNSSGDENGAWKKMAERVKSVVKEELVTQQRPGGILYK